jgi:hypothetical protein
MDESVLNHISDKRKNTVSSKVEISEENKSSFSVPIRKRRVFDVEWLIGYI